MEANLPLLIEAEQLHKHLQDENLVVIDLSIPQVYKEGHVPGAVHLAYPKIVQAHDDVDCDIPSNETLTQTLSSIGIKPEHHVVAYDAQYNPMACRLIWTLEELGHKNFSIMNGGWHAWRDSGLPIESTINVMPESNYPALQRGSINVNIEQICDHINNPNGIILDTRMHEEFTNELVMTDRGGNIPGAIHFDWMNNIDEDNKFRLFNNEILQKNFKDLGITTDKDIIIYCQTHFRSAHTYMVLKHLGYKNIKAYAAGYSEWGNAENTKIENEFEGEED